MNGEDKHPHDPHAQLNIGPRFTKLPCILVMGLAI